jgi:hypothetical protein
MQGGIGGRGPTGSQIGVPVFVHLATVRAGRRAPAPASSRQRRCSSSLPIGSSHAPTSCLCTGRNGSDQVALPLVVRLSSEMPLETPARG